MHPTELIRVSRQLPLPGVGMDGQKKLKHAKVAIIGMGGLGCPAALYLAGAGIGSLGIFDHDKVEITNLHRQPLYSTAQVGMWKVDAAAFTLKEHYPDTTIIPYNLRFTLENKDLLDSYNLILDCTDNAETRYTINLASLATGKPLVYGAIAQFKGYLTILNHNNGPCLGCIFPKPAQVPSCSQAGILGVTTGHVGTLLATEALKLLLEMGRLMSGRLLVTDLLEGKFQELFTKKNPNCPYCSLNQIPQFISLSVREQDVKDWITSGKTVHLIDIRDHHEGFLDRIPGSIPIATNKLTDLSIIQAHLNSRDYTVLFCQFGNLSLSLATTLRDQGFKNVYSLEGGLQGWLKG